LQTIGKYQVEKVLGRGGMGTVYQAHDPVIHRKVALKMMIPGLAETPELKLRFLREAQAAGGLRHRNIVTVYDLGEDHGQPYIAMEFIEGADLEQIIQRREPLTVEWKLDVIRQVCEGLAYAHRNGIVHRDVKPANVRVTPEGEVKIMDFGLAHLQSSTMTKNGLVLGTVHYMAPEQVEGLKVDHRADIFSVGAIAYELLAYRRAFEGESPPNVMFRIMREAPDMSALPETEYSPGLDRIVARALAKPVAERYQDLEAMRDDLERLVRDTASRLVAAVDRDTKDLARAIEQARADGHLQMALTLCRRWLAVQPAEPTARRLAAEVEQAIRDKEVEQLSGMALGYAADGDLDLALKIASRVARVAPDSPRYRELAAYLQEETVRREASALLATAQEHIVLGNLEEARAAAEEVLAAQPDHALAREIRDRATRVIERRDRSALPPPAPPAPAPPAPAPPVVAAPPPESLTPLPEGPPTDAEAAALLEAARRHLKARDPAKAVPLLEQAATRAPGHPTITRLLDVARLDARKAEAASLASAALNHFLQNDHARARRVVEKALSLDAGNRRAQELLDVLGVLG
jgi:tRNA A-37 threonylcarbamoyl transferase component Bud32/tetratricopeptide (TPR) repeat protein